MRPLKYCEYTQGGELHLLRMHIAQYGHFADTALRSGSDLAPPMVHKNGWSGESVEVIMMLRGKVTHDESRY